MLLVSQVRACALRGVARTSAKATATTSTHVSGGAAAHRGLTTSSTAATTSSTSTVKDVVVVGGGLMGVWTAIRAAQSGASVTLVDQFQVRPLTSCGHLWPPVVTCGHRCPRVLLRPTPPYDCTCPLAPWLPAAFHSRQIASRIPLSQPQLRPATM